MKYIKIFTIIFLTFTVFNNSKASDIYFIDIKLILNKSKAGKGAQTYLKKKFDDENQKLKKESIALKKDESDLISKKKLISNEEYKKKLNLLREKNISYQKKRRNASNEWINKKNEARSKLIKALNPILQKYMNENQIEVIVDKKNILLANSKFDLTDEILKILDKELKSIELK
tara:strand:+ start:1073 stop:1594 length:522 start_codon:yes stop_codon:yes gene_type:complete